MLGESDLSNQACEQWGQRFVFLIPTRLAPLLFKQVCDHILSSWKYRVNDYYGFVYTNYSV
ncbi:hypothetical protein PVAP13_3KG529000 [Panicum virgatum]|uniref:Uncharacterized protein n=1 Tax=Panicum virgatum TaxID=38727 RepID=A0A8T0V7E5_PANVG|nr:hypothetical protein PVAP13_3KG529000 [Panicum virgatum]